MLSFGWLFVDSIVIVYVCVDAVEYIVAVTHRVVVIAVGGFTAYVAGVVVSDTCVKCVITFTIVCSLLFGVFVCSVRHYLY